MRGALGLLLLFALAAPTAGATTYLVRPDGNGDYPNIQAAIDASQDGDVINLGSGVFRGWGNHDLNVGGKAIVLKGISGDPRVCVIDCMGQYYGVLLTSGEGSGTRLESLTIERAYAQQSYGAAVLVSGSPTITNCVFSHCLAWYGGAVYCQSSSASFVDCVFSFNSALGWGGGAAFSDPGLSAPTLIRCSFDSNTAPTGGGVGVFQCSPMFTECTFSSNAATTYSGGAISFDESHASVLGCTFYDNAAATNGGSILCGASELVLSHSLIAFSRTGEALYSAGGGTAYLECCDLYGNAGGDWV